MRYKVHLCYEGASTFDTSKKFSDVRRVHTLSTAPPLKLLEPCHPREIENVVAIEFEPNAESLVIDR